MLWLTHIYFENIALLRLRLLCLDLLYVSNSVWIVSDLANYSIHFEALQNHKIDSYFTRLWHIVSVEGEEGETTI